MYIENCLSCGENHAGLELIPEKDELHVLPNTIGYFICPKTREQIHVRTLPRGSINEAHTNQDS